MKKTHVTKKVNCLACGSDSFWDNEKKFYVCTACGSMWIKNPAMKKTHVSHNSGYCEWYTPENIIDLAKNVMGTIDLDPASCSLANKTVKATNFYDIKSDGLNKKWVGNVWLNPPFTRGIINKFIDKIEMELETIEEIIILVNNITESKWFQKLLTISNSICFISKRISFSDEFGNKKSKRPLQGQIIFYIGLRSLKFKEEFEKIGIVKNL